MTSVDPYDNRGASFGPYSADYAPSGSRKMLLDLVPQGSRVLDVGCWTGYNARYLAQRRCHTVGLEGDPKAARLAMAHCTEVLVGNLEDPSRFKPGPVDAILL